MKITVKQSGFFWHIYIEGYKYYKGFMSQDEAELSEDYKHFKQLIDGR